jgi:membrane-associated protease RseP (regulator of RpoE activity)
VASVKALGGFVSPGSLANYGDQLTGSASDEADDSRPVSVIGVARIAGQAALFEFMGLLITTNIFLGIVNAVPLPPLDGGHFAIATYERIRSRKGKKYHADVQKLLPVAAAVLVLIITLGATSIWLDIVRPISNPLQ